MTAAAADRREDVTSNRSLAAADYSIYDLSFYNDDEFYDTIELGNVQVGADGSDKQRMHIHETTSTEKTSETQEQAPVKPSEKGGRDVVERALLVLVFLLVALLAALVCMLVLRIRN